MSRAELHGYGTIALMRSVHGPGTARRARRVPGAPPVVALPSEREAAAVRQRIARTVELLRTAPDVTGAPAWLGAVTLDELREQLTRQQVWFLDRARYFAWTGADAAAGTMVILAERCGAALAALGRHGGEALAAFTLPVREELRWGEYLAAGVVLAGLAAGLVVLLSPGGQLALVGVASGAPIFAGGGASVLRGAGLGIASTGAGGGRALAALPNVLPNLLPALAARP